MDRVVVVPEGAPLDAGWVVARAALIGGESVRVVGCGATYASAWPAWAYEQPGLTVAEIGAYEARTRMEGSRAVAATLAAWCDVVFEGIVEGHRGSEIFGGGAASRLLQGAMDASAVVEGLAALHPSAKLELTDRTWAGATALGDGVSRATNEHRTLPAVVAAGVVASVARALDEYARGAWSRAKMAGQDEALAPRLWLGLIPDWTRANKHLVSTLAREALEHGEPLGVLLLGSWGVGTRDEATHVVLGDDVWPGLTWLREWYPRSIRVAQAVMPARRRALVAALGRAAAASARATARAMHAGPPPGMPGSVSTMAFAKLLSRDVVQAVLAADAAREARARMPECAHIVLCAANLPGLAAPERVLARAGVRTAEYMHGLGNDAWHGTAESHVDLRFVWTDTDAAGLSPTGQRTVTAGLPVPRPGARALGHQNVLILTNYFHRDLCRDGQSGQRGAYQRELLDVPALLRRELPDWSLRFRWRAHPAEVPALVAQAQASLRAVEMSRSADFADDLEWADVVVAAHSSTVVESLFAGRPVFVHLRPELVHSPFAAYAHPSRGFRNAESVVPEIVTCLRALAAGDLDAALAPDREARRRLVGPQGPVALYTAVCDWIAEGGG